MQRGCRADPRATRLGTRADNKTTPGPAILLCTDWSSENDEESSVDLEEVVLFNNDRSGPMTLMC